MNNVNMKFKLIHDSNKILCFVGSSYINKTLKDYFDQFRDCEIYRIEEIENNSQDWFDARQFLTASGSISLKKRIVDSLKKYNPDYFSVVAERNHIGFNVSIGKGTYISDFNVLLDNTVIGNHVVMTHYITASHDTEIKDFCHIGPGTYLLFTTLGIGSYVATKSSFVGKIISSIDTIGYCNYLIGSTVTKNITSVGTYYGNRRVNSDSSIDEKIE